MTIVKERLIYSAGTFRIEDDLARCRRLVITASVLRLPFSAKYVNERINPRKFFLGYMTVFVNEYVYSVVALEYESQCVLLWENPAIQLYTTALCIAKVASDNLVALRASIPLTGTLLPLPFDVAPFPGCSFTNLKFKLEPGCRISVVAAGEEIIECTGISPEATVPELLSPIPPYPDDQARDEDPARSDPEPGELPGDTAPATIQDPDSGLPPSEPCITTIRGSGLNTATCGSLGNLGDYPFPGYGELVPVTLSGCAGLQLYIDGIDQGAGLVFFTDAFVLSRTGDCTPP